MPKAQIDSIVADKLAMVGLTQWAGKFGHELSGGMQQRVGLARAFATDADILLMDEPFSALDPLIRDKLQDELLLLQKDLKKTIIFVSHDLDEALKIGNHIAILEGGRIVQWGTAEDILLRPADAYVAEFVKHMNPLNVLRGSALMTPAAALRRSEGEDARSRRPHPVAARRRRQADRRDPRRRRRSLAEVDGATGEATGTASTSSSRHRPEDALRDRAAPFLGQPDRTGRPARRDGGILRRRRNLSRAAAAAPGRGGRLVLRSRGFMPNSRSIGEYEIKICLCRPSAPQSIV